MSYFFHMVQNVAHAIRIENLTKVFGDLTAVNAWSERVAAFGHGDRSEMDADEALQIAATTPSTAEDAVDEGDPLQLSAGDAVAVSPDDYGIVPVQGQLVRLTVDDVAVRRADERAGEVVVHFPRAGYRVEAG